MNLQPLNRRVASLLARTTCEPLLMRAPLLRIPMDTSSYRQEFAQAPQPDDGLSSRMLRRRQRILRNLSIGSRQCSIASSGCSSGSTSGSRCSLTRVRITRHCGGARELRPFAASLDITTSSILPSPRRPDQLTRPFGRLFCATSNFNRRRQRHSRHRRGAAADDEDKSGGSSRLRGAVLGLRALDRRGAHGRRLWWRRAVPSDGPHAASASRLHRAPAFEPRPAHSGYRPAPNGTFRRPVRPTFRETGSPP